MSDEYRIADAYWRERTKAAGEEESLGEYLLRRRSDGLSLREIEHELRDTTNGVISKTPTTLGSWIRAAQQAEALSP